jgi:hypothetical protein
MGKCDQGMNIYVENKQKSGICCKNFFFFFFF